MEFNKVWFENKVKVGAYPVFNNELFNASEWDYVINVSDEYYPDIALEIQNMGCKYFWFPMNECKADIGVNSIYGACTILFLAEQKNKSVYLHCHAGINRSQIVYAAYYFMRTGKQIEFPSVIFVNMLLAACFRDYLPSIDRMGNMLSDLNLILQTDLINTYCMGGQLDVLKVDNLK
jgi:hypothetical protein